MSNEITEAYRKRCFDEHGKACEICESDENIHVHHIDGDKLNNNKENLMPLCASHHRKVESATLNEHELKRVMDRLPEEVVNANKQRVGFNQELEGEIKVTNPEEHKIESEVDNRGRVTVGKEYAGKTVNVVMEVVEDG